ncbi:MAG: hypothetical protein ABIJ45_10315 [Candidatus Zixiibacteriota bacterium]
MKIDFMPFRVTSILLLAAYLNLVFLPGIAFGQSSDCQFDKSKPSIENARKNFLALNYKCAEEELNALIATESLETEKKADAHVLLAEVYYAKVRDNSEKKDKVITQFVAAFEAYREWKGELNIKSPEFMAMMKEAQVKVDSGESTKPAEEPVVKPTEEKVVVEASMDETTDDSSTKAVPIITAEKKKKDKKPWYTQWWAIGLGVGVVVLAAVALGGGSDSSGGTTPDGPLDDFPAPPKPTKGK